MIRLGFESFKNTVTITRKLIMDKVEDGQTVLDCTVGNGHDTLLLAKGVGNKGLVYGFDIQDLAIENTYKLLDKHGLADRVTLIKDSHEYIDKYIDEGVDFVIYNLGYLPGSDKSIITRPKSTLKSIKIALELLKGNGILVITSYIGHPGGMEEKERVEKYLAQLDQRRYSVLKHQFINHINNPPILYVVEKVGL